MVAADVVDLNIVGTWVLYSTDLYDEDLQIDITSFGGVNLSASTWTIGGRPALEYLRLRELGYF